ncbi:MAG: hypothetical protein EAX96_09150 [Candidatus Lokiarchaeota archaeon]|nr:hypothetical protein [Candidatus Lokiarchaeota archaeon]
MKAKKIIISAILFLFFTNIIMSFSINYEQLNSNQAILSISSAPLSSQSVSLDTQWNLELIGARKSRAAGLTGANASNPNDPVVIAVLDSGIFNHSELKNATGHTKIVNSTDFTIPSQGVQDDTAHGTHVAGIIASNVRGIAPDVILYNFKVIGSGGTGSSTWLQNALNDLATNHPPNKGGIEGVDIVTMSIGIVPDEWNDMTTGEQNDFKAAINACLNSGMILVAATGNYNSGAEGINYPAALSGVIAVGAINMYEVLTSYSEYGSAVDFVGPGGDQIGQIYSTFPEVNGSYGLMSGTSQATPHITGMIAALLGTNSTKYNNNTIKSELQKLCKDLGALGRDDYYGYGLPQFFPEDSFVIPFIIILIITAIIGVIVIIIPGRKE